jgi:hypothetical protein
LMMVKATIEYQGWSGFVTKTQLTALFLMRWVKND